MFDLIRFNYVLIASTIMQDLLRFHHPVFPFILKTIEIEDCVGPTKKHISKRYSFLRPTLAKQIKNMDLQHFTNNNLFNDVFVLLMCLAFFKVFG